MKFNFKKIAAVSASFLMAGMTLGFAGAVYPNPFVQDGVANYAVVYGTGFGVASSDLTAANKVNNDLLSLKTSLTSEGSSTTSSITSDFSASVSILDEIDLGQDDIISSELRKKVEDNKLSTLLDGKIYWDSGDGEDSYDFHEEILLTADDEVTSKLKLVTNMNHPDGEDLDSFVVLQNDESLRYRLVFDDEITYADESDADALEITFLGKDYQITDFDEVNFGDVTISLSEEKVVKKGDVIKTGDATLTINEIFEHSVEINGVLVKDSGSIKKINGIEVKVESTSVHFDSTLSKAEIRFGEDIERDISDGMEYIKNDETWEWDMGLNEADKQYIGVKYALRSTAYDEDEPEENPISVGESYIFPENYAALSFDSLTDVNYKDFDLSFDDRDLYHGDSDSRRSNIDVAVLEGEDDDSITLVYDGMDIETDSLYFNYTTDGVEVYFKDIDEDVKDGRAGRIQFSEMYDFDDSTLTIVPVDWDVLTITLGDHTTPPEDIVGYQFTDNGDDHEVFSIVFGDGTYYFYFDGEGLIVLDEEVITPITNYEFEGHGVTKNRDGTYTYEEVTEEVTEDISYNIATLIVKDTEIRVGLDLKADKNVTLTLTNDMNEVTKIALSINEAGEFKHLGDLVEDAEAKDVIVDGTSIGTKDYDVMDHYGTIIKDPENYANSDRVLFSVPDEQVQATISLKGQGEEVITQTDTNQTGVSTTGSEVEHFGSILIKDTEVASAKDMNLIIVGGSCINSAAARILGSNVPLCGADWTKATNAGTGQFLVREYISPYNPAKVALIVAGYEAVDTTAAVNSLFT